MPVKLSKPNIVLITIDSLRYDALSDNFLKKLSDFGNVISYSAFTAGMPTFYALPAILGGIYPFKYGLRVGAPQNVPLVSEVFRSNGYVTFGYSAGNAYTSRFADYNRGFNVFRDFIRSDTKSKRSILIQLFGKIPRFKRTLSILLDNYSPPHISKHLIKIVIQDLFSANPSNFFVWMHFMDVHIPYYPFGLKIRERFKRAIVTYFMTNLFRRLGNYNRQNLGINSFKKLNTIISQMYYFRRYKKFLRMLYEQALRELENNIINLIDIIKKKYPNTYFLITSDHGEEFFDNVAFGHLPLFHNESLVRIPFIILGSDIENSSSDKIVSNVDVAPTLCDIANIKAPGGWDGVSVFSSKVRDFLFTETLFAYLPKPKETINNYDNLLISAHSYKGKSTTCLLERGLLIKRNIVGSFTFEEEPCKIILKRYHKLKQLQRFIFNLKFKKGQKEKRERESKNKP